MALQGLWLTPRTGPEAVPEAAEIWVDPAVLGDQYGKLLRELSVENFLRLWVRT